MKTKKIIFIVFTATLMITGCSFDVGKDGCVDVIIPARNIETNECKVYPNPCEVPKTGWIKDDACADDMPVSTSNNSRSCEFDTDCAIRNTNCERCGQNLTCLNKSVESCEYDNARKEIQCEPPLPPWVTNCKCVESICVNCRGDECKTD